MAKGLNVSIINNSSDNIITEVKDVYCMNDTDNLNNLNIERSTQLSDIYVESSAELGCTTKTSSFMINFLTEDKLIMGTAGFQEKNNTWTQQDDSHSANVEIVLNTGKQYHTVITISNRE